MLVQRIEYQCNYASESMKFEDSKTSLPNMLIDVMKCYSIIVEPNVVYSSQPVTTLNQAPETH